MHLRFNMFAIAACAVAIVLATAGARAADGYRLSGPLTHDNLSVYFVHGEGSGGAAPLTLEQAQAQGALRIQETATHPVMVDNLSNQSVFIQLGNLIAGGMQDQVAGTSLLLPPHSGLTPLVTFCVDPFRSSPREGEDPKLFAAIGALIPSRLAKLSILSGFSDASAAGKIREQGVWWSIDSIRAGLSQNLGEPLETPRTVRWDLQGDSRANVLLASRRSGWTTSLPLALEDTRLAQAQQSFIDAFRTAEAEQADVIGAAFAINGHLVGADIYQSHALFAQMWPKLLRALATETLAAGSLESAPAPSLEDVSAFLAAPAPDQARTRALGSVGVLTDSETAISIETAGRDNNWVHRSTIAKLDPAIIPAAPEALLVRMLETGEVEGRSLASLRERDTIVVHNNAEGGTWSATLPSPADARALELLQRRDTADFGAWMISLFESVVSLVLLFVFARMMWREIVKPAILRSTLAVRRGVAILARTGLAALLFTAQGAAEILGFVAGLAARGWHGLLIVKAAALARTTACSRQPAYAPIRRMPAIRTAPQS